MTPSDLLQAMVPVLRQLEELGVTHYVGGSIASSVHGMARTTLDADVIAVLREEHVGAFVVGLANEFYVDEPMIRKAIEDESSFNVIHLATMFNIDVFVAKRRPFDQSVLSRIRKEKLGEEDVIETFLASSEDVVLNKLEWYRLGDEVSERQWNDVLGVLKVQRAALDLDYLRAEDSRR